MLVSRMLAGSGVTAVSRSLRKRNGAIIFYGHRVSDDDEGFLQGLSPRWFDDQLRYLTRHYEAISLSRLVSCLEMRQPVPENSFVVTFDDGFRDNLEQALPICEKYHVTATVFLVTGAVASGELPWSQRLGYLFQNARGAVVVGGEPKSLESAADRRWAYLHTKKGLMVIDRVKREKELARLGDELAVRAPNDRMLTWDDARYMKSRGFEFGSHTFSHPYLAMISAAEAEWEMERSRLDLVEQLAIEGPVFCFPSGSLNSGLVDVAKRLGFRGSFASSPVVRVNSLATVDPFSMRRTCLPNGPVVQLEAELDSPIPELRRAYRGASALLGSGPKRSR